MGATSCGLADVWYRRRSTPSASYTKFPRTCEPFVMKFQSGLLRLVVSPKCLGQTIYQDFGEEPADRRLAWGTGGTKGNDYAQKGAAQAAKDSIMDSGMSSWYDPWAPVSSTA